jgi:membrane fusion protein (multidrug efflux system)
MQVSRMNATTYQEYPASIAGMDNVEIRPQITGILQQIFVDEGAFVQAGRPLFKIDEAPFRQQLNNASARLHSAQGALTNAELEIEKLTPLVQNKVVSDIQMKTAMAAKEVAVGNVEQANADIASAKINLGYTLIKAPVRGFVGLLPRKRGSVVSPADPTALTDISDVHNVHVYFALSESDFINFKDAYPGKTLAEKIGHLPEVQLVLADDSAYSLKGKIDLINGQFDKNTGAITVRATFHNPEGLLRSGNTGKIRLFLVRKNEIRVPQSATLEMQDKTFVFVLGDSDKVARKPIVINGRTDGYYLVKSGLEAGDKIVLTGFDHLHEGDKIVPTLQKTEASKMIVKN